LLFYTGILLAGFNTISHRLRGFNFWLRCTCSAQYRKSHSDHGSCKTRL